MKLHSVTVGPFQENSYLVHDEASGSAVLVDPGAEPDRIVQMIRNSGAECQAIWVTHAHVDHIGGIAGVRRSFDVPVYLHPDGATLFAAGAVHAGFYGIPFEQPAPADRELAEGDVLTVGNVRFRVMLTPGHAPGHVVFVTDGIMLGGDLLFAGSIGRTDLPSSDPAQMERSLERVSLLPPETVVYPGHGPVTTIGDELASNPFLAAVPGVLQR